MLVREKFGLQKQEIQKATPFSTARAPQLFPLTWQPNGLGGFFPLF
jgi:hypothetical protein